MSGKLKIAGWQKISLIDYPGKIASVIFLAGCNMRCHYCHNSQLWDVTQNRFSVETILSALQKYSVLIDAVVVSGGEPTVYPNLIPLLKQIREMGLLIKLDTNGTQPAVIQTIVEQGLVDYIALDLKAPAHKHVAITGLPIDPILTTAQYLKQQKRIPYMFRTTLSPRLDVNDLIEIGKNIVTGANLWQIQQCRVDGAYAVSEIQKMVTRIKRYAQNIVVKGI